MAKNIIPTINISSIISGFESPKSISTINKIKKACINIGFFQAEDGIRDRSPSRGLGDVYKRQLIFQ